jgi:hypothetical protein
MGQGTDIGVWELQGGLDIISDEPAQGSQELRQTPRRRWGHWVPEEEIAEQLAKLLGLLGCERFFAIGCGVAAEAHCSALLFPAAEQGPLGAIGVDEVGERLKLAPLRKVAAFESLGARPFAGGLKLDVTGEEAGDVYSKIGAAAETLNLGLSSSEDVLVENGAR